MKSKRQEKILELIEKYNIETQEELIARLAECGIESKQTTVSRDIKELYLYKEPIGGGRSRYAVSGKADHIDNTKRLKLILNECSVGVDYAGIVVLLKTLPGLADAAGAAIDAMKLPDMLGCISGNDAVAIVARGEQEAERLCYDLREVLKHDGKGIEGLRVAMSGYGNVGWGIMKKIDELGGKVTYFAGPDGYIHDPDGVCGEEKLNFILEMRAKDPMHCKPYADKFGVEFVEGQKCWGVKDVDVYMPAATQNDVNMEWAKKIAESGVPYYIEVGNMPTTNDALAFLMSQKHITVAPSKAVNACGVSVSELEMAQNAQRIYWSAEEVDAKMESIMKNIYDASVEAAERYGLGYNLVAGANIAGFQKVADAMMAQGIF